jgi:hypothetical protein
MAQTNVQRRKAGYYYRQKIPADLLTHYGKREIVRSLGTSKKREASASGYKQGHSWTQDFTRIRAGGLQTVPRAIAEAQGLLEALDALPIEQAGERPQPKKAKVLLRNIDDDFVTKTCATYINEIDGADFVEAGRKAGNEWLFPELEADKYGNNSSTFGKRWNRKLPKVISLREVDRTQCFDSLGISLNTSLVSVGSRSRLAML